MSSSNAPFRTVDPGEQYQQLLQPGDPLIDQTLTGLTNMEADLRRQNDELNERINGVMAKGAYKMPANDLGN